MKRILSITLMLCICISLLTVAASATDGNMLLIAPAPTLISPAPPLIMPAPPLIMPAPSAGGITNDGYSDVDSGHWAEDAIYSWTEKGALQGNPDGTFAPDDFMTNAQYATFISKAIELQNADLSVLDRFGDADKAMWYAQAMANCVAAGIIGDDTDTLAPDEYVTREQAVVMICHAYDIEPLDNAPPNFIDAADISADASAYIAALAQMGALKGYPDKTLKSKGYLTRAEAVYLTTQTVDQILASVAYELKAVLKAAHTGNKTVSDVEQQLIGNSGITTELCYMAHSNTDILKSVYSDLKLVESLKAAVDAFNAGADAWSEYAEQIPSLMTGDMEFIEAFASNARLSTLEQGKEYTVVFGGYQLTVSVVAR